MLLIFGSSYHVMIPFETLEATDSEQALGLCGPIIQRNSTNAIHMLYDGTKFLQR